MDVLKILGSIAAAVLLSGCGAVKDLPTVVYQKDTVYVSKVQTEVVRDSVYITDREVIREKGDTVYIERWSTQYRDRWRDREVHDTTYVDKLTEKEVIKEVERELTWGQSALMNLGKVFLGMLLLVLLYVIIRLTSGKILRK